MKAFRYGIAAGPADVPDLAAEPDPASDLAAEPDLARAATGLPARLPKARRGAVAPRTGLQGMSTIYILTKKGVPPCVSQLPFRSWARSHN